jgi:hypothetical protein
MRAKTVIPKDTPRVSGQICDRASLPTIFDSLSLAGWFHLSALRSWKSLRVDEPAAPSMLQVSLPSFANIWDYPASDKDSADQLVLGYLSDDHRQAWRICLTSAASTGPYLLRDRMDDAAQAAPGYGERG